MAMPAYLFFFAIFSLASFGFPGTNGFVSELLVLIAVFSRYPYVGFVAILGAVLSAAYMLRLLQKMVWDRSTGHGEHHGESRGGKHGALQDLNMREAATLAFLTFFVLWIGFYPAPLLKMMDSTVSHLVSQVKAGTRLMD
jgi:NADH-quinone oxidoreductase subunit M